MPLKTGTTQKVVSSNIKEMKAAGHPIKQSIAAALRMKDESQKRK